MATTAQLDANRANALLSTGPRTPAGKLTSSANSLSHGLTTRQALLPGEDATKYQEHHQDYLDRYHPSTHIDHELVVELADLHWRRRRVPAFEAELLSNEVLALTTDPELAPLIERFESQSQILAFAFTRLVQSKVLPNLYGLESRLTRRADRIYRQLESERQARPLQPTRTPAPEPKPAILKNEANPSEALPPQPIRVAPEPGRNESCPCKSGLKYKRCCLGKPAVMVAAA